MEDYNYDAVKNIFKKQYESNQVLQVKFSTNTAFDKAVHSLMDENEIVTILKEVFNCPNMGASWHYGENPKTNSIRVSQYTCGEFEYKPDEL